MSAATDVLRSICLHRYLSGEQVRRLHFADASSLRVTEVLSSRALCALELAELVESVPARGATRRGEKLWFATRSGLAVTGNGRTYVPSKEKALALQEHSLAVNEVGLAFVAAARARGDECGALSWEHEIPLSRSGSNLVVVDGVLSYVGRGLFADEPDALEGVTVMFELDQGSYPDAKLMEKLRMFAEVQASPRLWAERFAHGWPMLLVVVAGSERSSRARVGRAVKLWGGERLPVLFTTLADLRVSGPFAAIWRSPERGESLNWLGEEVCARLNS